jgi:uncharacterized coiled-coil protein SlyX
MSKNAIETLQETVAEKRKNVEDAEEELNKAISEKREKVDRAKAELNDYLKARYRAALHAVQTTLIEMGDTLATPKHLRVGIDSAHVSDGALVRLLISKGVITEREHLEALVAQAEEERGSYDDRLSKKTGKKIHLL